MTRMRTEITFAKEAEDAMLQMMEASAGRITQLQLSANQSTMQWDYSGASLFGNPGTGA